MNLDFYTKLNGSLTKKMIICANGNVGIGNTSPSAKLHVATGANTDGIFLGRISSCTRKYLADCKSRQRMSGHSTRTPPTSC